MVTGCKYWYSRGRPCESSRIVAASGKDPTAIRLGAWAFATPPRQLCAPVRGCETTLSRYVRAAGTPFSGGTEQRGLGVVVVGAKENQTGLS